MAVDQKTKDDLNVGDDPRLFPRFSFWWQKLTQITFLRNWDVVLRPAIELFPPGGYLSFSLPWNKPDFEFWLRETREGKKFEVPVHPVVNIRAGWLWIPALIVAHWQGWPWWAWVIGFVLGIFLNWRRDRNSGESYWTLSVNVDYEAKTH